MNCLASIARSNINLNDEKREPPLTHQGWFGCSIVLEENAENTIFVYAGDYMDMRKKYLVKYFTIRWEEEHMQNMTETLLKWG